MLLSRGRCGKPPRTFATPRTLCRRMRGCSSTGSDPAHGEPARLRRSRPRSPGGKHRPKPAGHPRHLLSRAAARCRHVGDRRPVRSARVEGIGTRAALHHKFQRSAAAEFVRRALKRLSPAVVLTTTAFALGAETGKPTALDGPDVPVLQLVMANTQRAAWRDSARRRRRSRHAHRAARARWPRARGRCGFKERLPTQSELAFTAMVNQPEPDRIAMVAERVAALTRPTTNTTAATAARRSVFALCRSAGRAMRSGSMFPASVLALLSDLALTGYSVEDVPGTAPAPCSMYSTRARAEPTAGYFFHAHRRLAGGCNRAGPRHWGDTTSDPDLREGMFQFRARAFGNVLVALPPDQDRSTRRADCRPDPAPAPRPAGLRAVDAAPRRYPRARAYGCAWHAGMAAR